MKSYRLDVTPRSAWGSPLQADTLFGHLCWALRYTQGEPRLRDFLHAFDDTPPPLVLSNGLPEDFLPRPGFPPLRRTPDERTETGHKKLKRVVLLRKDWFLEACPALSEATIQRALMGDGNIRGADPSHPELGYHNAMDRRTESVREQGGLLQSLDFRFREAGSAEEGTRLSVYLKTDYFSASALGDLCDVVARSGYGRDTSSGSGAFSFELTPFGFPPLPGANAFVSLSNFVPAPHDPTDGWYELMTKFGKFGKLGGDYAVGPGPGGVHNPFKKPILTLQAGSIFRDGSVREWYGRLVPDVHTDPDIRHYGLCYPLEVRL